MNRPSLNKTLGAIAVLLAVPALFIGNPGRVRRVSVDLNELSSLIEREEDHWTTTELADWLMQKNAGVRIVDLRDSADFARSRIPGAERIALSDLFSGKLRRDETIVLYSNGGTHASQAWILLRADGYRHVYTLRGGMLSWEDDILHPEPPLSPAVLARMRFFGGDPSRPSDTSGGSGAKALTPGRITRKAPARPNVSPEPERRRDGC